MRVYPDHKICSHVCTYWVRLIHEETFLCKAYNSDCDGHHQLIQKAPGEHSVFEPFFQKLRRKKSSTRIWSDRSIAKPEIITFMEYILPHMGWLIMCIRVPSLYYLIVYFTVESLEMTSIQITLKENKQ